MATITDFTSLNSAMSDWLGDTLKVNSYPTFIQLFEAYINRNLAVREQQKQVSLTIVSGSATLPSDYMTWRSAVWTGTTPYVRLKWIDPAYFDTTPETTTANNGIPEYFTIKNTTLTIRKATDTFPVLFDYFSTVPALTAQASTNWLLTQHPDAYLFGSLVEAAAFGEYTEAAVLWKARRDAVIKEIQDEYSDQTGENSIREDSYF